MTMLLTTTTFSTTKIALTTIIFIVASQISLLRVDALFQPYHPLNGTYKPCKTNSKIKDSTNNNKRPRNKLVVALNLPFDVPTDALVKLGGDGANTGKYYAFAAQAAIDDINK